MTLWQDYRPYTAAMLKSMMFRLSLIILGLLALLAGCTGSQELRPSTLLVVGHTSNQLSLIETASLLDTLSEPRLLASRNLNGQAVALDVTSRADRRDSVVLLTSQGGSDWLEFFDVRAIDPTNFDDSSMFQTTRPALRLDAKGLELALNLTQRPLALCASAIQVSLEARYVALINDPQRCPQQLTGRGLLVLDISRQPPRLVYQRVSNIFPAIYIDQNAGLLYFLSEEAGGARLERLELATSDATTLLTLSAEDRQDSIRAIQPYGEALLLLRDANYTFVDMSNDANANPQQAQEGKTIATRSGAQSFVPDPLNPAGSVYIAGSRLTVHRNADDEDETSYSIVSPLTSFDSNGQLIYSLASERVGIFDVLSPHNSNSVALPELSSPTVATVVQGILSLP